MITVGNRDFKFELVRNGMTYAISHMFDRHGSETFDVTDCTEFDVDQLGLTSVQDGDELVTVFYYGNDQVIDIASAR